MAELLPKLLLQHDDSPIAVLENVHAAFLQAVQQRAVQASVSPSGDGVAVALGQRLVVLHGLNSSSKASSASISSSNSNSGGNSGGKGGGSSPAAVEFVTAVDGPEAVTALCWLDAGGPSPDQCLLLGTSAGFLQLHSASNGALLLRQQLHHTPVLAAAVRWSGSGLDADDLSEDVSITFSEAVVRIPAWEVWAAVQWHARHGSSGSGRWWRGGSSGSAAGGSAPEAAGGGGGTPPHLLSFSKLTLPKGTGPRCHSVCLGPPPPTLYAALVGRQQQQHRVYILTAGVSPPLASFEAEESGARGLLSLVSDLASTTAQSLLGRAKAFVPGGSLLGGLRRRAAATAAPGSSSAASDGGGGGGGQQQGPRPERIPGEPATLAAAVWDEKRSILQMALSPCGRWAACCDSLGRVLLVDAGSTLVLRMLKGYRDAQVAWLVCGGSSGLGGGGRGDGGIGGRALPLAPLGGSSSSLGSLGNDSASTSMAGSLQGSAADLAALQQQAQQQYQQQQNQPQQRQRQQQDGGLGAEAAEGPQGRMREQRRQLLVIYAPRRGVVELWEPHTLRTRLGSVRSSSQQGLLLQQPARRGGAMGSGSGGGAAGGGGSGRSGTVGGGGWESNRCLLLDASSLTLTDLTPALTANL